MTGLHHRLRAAAGNARDPYIADVVLLAHMNGTNGSTSFIDSSPDARTLTAEGNAQIATDIYKFNGSAGKFDGSGDGVTTPYSATDFNWWTGDYTLEGWWYHNTIKESNPYGLHLPILIGNMDSGGTDAGWMFGPTAAGNLKFYANGPGAIEETGTSVTTGVWQHLAMTFVYSTSTLRLFVDGNLVKTQVVGTGVAYGGLPLRIGHYNGVGFDGRAAEIRITRQARYTASFTPPTAPFPNS